MTISDKIGSSSMEMMVRVSGFIFSFNVHRLLYAISEKHLNEDDVKSITLDIREQDVNVEREMLRLEKYRRTYNKEWPTEDNKRFNTSARFAFRMRSGIKGIKTQVRSFCKKSRRRWPNGKGEPQAIDHSLISDKEAYMRDLFGLDSYPPCVQQLFLAMISFNENVYKMLNISLEALSEEKETRKDVQRCMELMQEARERSRGNLISILEAIDSNPEIKDVILKTQTLQPTNDNPLLKEWVESRGDEEKEALFAQKYFHNCTQKDVDKMELIKIVYEADGKQDMIECMTIFNCDNTKARRINMIIANFDKLLPEKCKGNKIPAIHLHVFMRWCSDSVGYETFLNYFGKHYRARGGKKELVSKGALSGASCACARDNNKYMAIKKELLEAITKQFPAEPLQQSA